MTRSHALHTVGTRLTREDGELLDSLVRLRGVAGAGRVLGLTAAMVQRLNLGGRASQAAVERVAEKLSAFRKAAT